MSATPHPVLFTRLGFDPAYLPVFEDKLFIEGSHMARRLTNFFALLLFATVIATYGALSDSTATVIGAMLVAPLMEPIMAITAAAVMGSFPRVLWACTLTAAGIASVVMFSYLLSWVVPDVTISLTKGTKRSGASSCHLVGRERTSATFVTYDESNNTEKFASNAFAGQSVL